jgi:hypothetical protein
VIDEGVLRVGSVIVCYGVEQVDLFLDAGDLGRGAIDAIFAMALTEQERNQETW